MRRKRKNTALKTNHYQLKGLVEKVAKTILSGAALTGALISPSFFAEGTDFSASPLLSDVGFPDFVSGFNPISPVSYF